MLKATQGAGYARTVLSEPHALSAMLQEWDRAKKEPEDLEAVWGPPRKRLSFWGKVGRAFLVKLPQLVKFRVLVAPIWCFRREGIAGL